MSGSTPHTGIEPCVRLKTIVLGLTRVIVIELLALANAQAMAAGATSYTYDIKKGGYVHINSKV
jgi:hypothetical protein